MPPQAATMRSRVSHPMQEPTPALDLETVYRRHHPGVCRWIVALAGPGLDVDDLAQEVFLVVQRKLARFVGDDPTAWIYGITVRKVRAARRRAWFRRVLLRPGPPSPRVESGEVAPGPDELSERRERERAFWTLAGRLTEKRREVFVLSEVSGHTPDEIAGLLGVPAATVRTRLYHARRDFIALAKAHHEGGAE